MGFAIYYTITTIVCFIMITIFDLCAYGKREYFKQLGGFIITNLLISVFTGMVFGPLFLLTGILILFTRVINKLGQYGLNILDKGDK